MGSRLDPALSLNLVPYSYGRLALLDFIKLKASTYRRWTVIHMDIANFRLINQLLGYEQGDLILKEITNLLSASARYTWFNMGSGIWVGISEYRDVNFVTQQIKEGRLKTRDHIKQRFTTGKRFRRCVRFKS
ncbi:MULTISPECIES: diguanylate cyclase domain-containing protein [Pseudomonas]|uniref:Diguanylate cyclase (GGDEF) domain n=2 Tax=Pseudomonas TaxID=286 RepID=A0A2X2CYF5_PSELU|nr:MULTISPECIES: diguanylate cyclase [Pseudomonas]SER22610.1 Diguanylate cyclase, GGDEF domain [Pseudomonas lutea]SPZ04965.1 diguanylate cyclase (GGDEF) domain [Pseudomonas luteola]